MAEVPGKLDVFFASADKKAFAYLRRLGYTVQRVRRFIPSFFLAPADVLSRRPGGVSLSVIGRTVLKTLERVVRTLVGCALWPIRAVTSVGLSLWSPFRRSDLRDWQGSTYCECRVWRLRALAHLQRLFLLLSDAYLAAIRILCPQGSRLRRHPCTTALHATHTCRSSTSGSLQPHGARTTGTRAAMRDWNDKSRSTLWPLWSTSNRCSDTDWHLRSRDTPFPTLEQLDEVFNMLPEEPTGPANRVGPQYNKNKAPSRPADGQLLPLHQRLLVSLGLKSATPKRNANPMGVLRNGDRALVVAVNDCGNTGWIRFGRSGFESIAMV